MTKVECDDKNCFCVVQDDTKVLAEEKTCALNNCDKGTNVENQRVIDRRMMGQMSIKYGVEIMMPWLPPPAVVAMGESTVVSDVSNDTRSTKETEVSLITNV